MDPSGSLGVKAAPPQNLNGWKSFGGLKDDLKELCKQRLECFEEMELFCTVGLRTERKGGRFLFLTVGEERVGVRRESQKERWSWWAKNWTKQTEQMAKETLRSYLQNSNGDTQADGNATTESDSESDKSESNAESDEEATQADGNATAESDSESDKSESDQDSNGAKADGNGARAESDNETLGSDDEADESDDDTEDESDNESLGCESIGSKGGEQDQEDEPVIPSIGDK